MVHLREQLTAEGLDAGPVTLQWHLAHAGFPVPSTSTIRRILGHHGLITPQPHKRPRSSYHRFAAEQPNECWQSDFTHWTLADGSDTEILNWLDDHSRYLLSATAYRRVGRPRRGRHLHHHRRRITGCPPPPSPTTARSIPHDSPTATTTSNASLASLGITQKNGHPGHPQTQGKIERFHQTLKRWLAARPRPATIADLQDPARRLPHHLQHPTRPPRPPRQNHPRTGLPRSSQSQSHRPTQPSTSASVTTSSTNSANSPCATAADLHHLGTGRAHAHTPVLILVTTTTVTVISKTRHHVLSSHTINPEKNYWPNQHKNPGPWPGNL